MKRSYASEIYSPSRKWNRLLISTVYLSDLNKGQLYGIFLGRVFLLDLKLSLIFYDTILWSKPVLEKLLYGVRLHIRVTISPLISNQDTQQTIYRRFWALQFSILLNSSQIRRFWALQFRIVLNSTLLGVTAIKVQ